MTPPIARLVENEEVAGHIDHRVGRVISGKRLYEGVHQVAVPVGFRHGFAVRSRVIKLFGCLRGNAGHGILTSFSIKECRTADAACFTPSWSIPPPRPLATFPSLKARPK